MIQAYKTMFTTLMLKTGSFRKRTRIFSFRINLLKLSLYIIIWASLSFRLFFVYNNLIINSINAELGFHYLQNGITVTRRIAQIEEISGFGDDDNITDRIENIVNNSLREPDLLKFIVIIDEMNNIIAKENFSFPEFPQLIEKYDDISIYINWLMLDENVMIIFSGDVVWYKGAKIYIAISSKTANPLKKYLIQSLLLWLLILLFSCIKFKDIAGAFCPAYSEQNPCISGFINSYKKVEVKRIYENDMTPLYCQSSGKTCGGSLFCGFPVGFGDYRLLKKIGKGGMSEVFKAEKDGNFYAVKISMPDQEKPEYIIDKLFRREIEILNQLKSENIIYIHDAFKVGEYNALVMEYIEGKNLEEIIEYSRIHEKKFSINQAIFIILEICQGLAYAHSKHIIHRDIKPANILISFDGEVKIGDLGIAKKLKIFPCNQKDSIIPGNKGTPSYMSPEQALEALLDEPIDHRSDIYSLGLICYELLSQKKIREIRKDINNIPELLTVASGIPPELNFLIMKCLMKNRLLRYESVQQISDAIIELKHSAGIMYDNLDMKNFMSDIFRAT